MSRTPRPVSEVYSPANGSHYIKDEPIIDHYATWGYSIGYELDGENKPVPESGNTAIFRIAPKGLTEPVFVTKQEKEATFTINVLDGKGLFIRAQADGTVDLMPLVKGTEVVVRPGEAYSYVNTDDTELILYDVALPAFRVGDDIELTSSLIPEQKPTPMDGYSACVVSTAEGKRVIELPEAFFAAMSEAMR